jgi:hypothetical protein
MVKHEESFTGTLRLVPFGGPDVVGQRAVERLAYELAFVSQASI